MATLRPRCPTPTQRTRTSSAWPRSAAGCAPSVKTWISARESWPTRARAVRTASPSRLGRSVAPAPRMAASACSRSWLKGASTRGCTAASITMTSAPVPRRPTRSRAWRWARPKRDGETSVAFMEAEVSRTMTIRLAPCPMTVTAGRAKARARARRARSCRMRSGSRCRRWKNVDASRSRRDGSQRRRLGTVASRRRTLRKYKRTRGTESAPTSRASGERKLTGRPSQGERASGRSSCEEQSLELPQHHLLDGRVGDHPVIDDLVPATEGLGAPQEVLQPLAIAAERLGVHGQVADFPRFRVGEAQIAGERGVDLLGREHVDHMHVEAVLEERLEPALVARGIEQVGDEHGHPRLPRAQGIGGQSLAERGRPVCAKPCRELEEGKEVSPPARRAPPFRHAITHHGHPDSLEAGQADEAEGGGETGSIAQLGRLAESHGAGAVEEEVEVQVLLVHEELQVEAIEAAIDVPVDVAEVVARAVRAIIGELHAHALVRALALAPSPSAEGASRKEGQAFELSQELRRQKVLSPGRGGGDHRFLFLVERLEVVLHLPVVVARHLLARHVFLHLLAVLPEHAHVLEARGHV